MYKFLGMKKVLTLVLLFITCFLQAATWLVGATRTYTMPSQVSSLVGNGDTVLIDVGIYYSDVAYWGADDLVLRGSGGIAHLESNGLSYGDKAIWVIGGDNTTVEYIEFSECTSTSQNGAGIRQEGANLTVSHCYFRDNENGILAGTVNPSTILIEYSEFNHNGAGDGFSHNLYINHVDTLIFRYNYSHHCTVGHELKSRANFNYILYNRLSNELAGDASREIDLPNGGTSILLGNIIEQGPNSQNSGIVGYGLEGLTNPTPHNLYLVNNTVVNDRSTGTFVSVQAGTALYKAYNNIFAGPGTILNGAPTVLDSTNNLYCTVANAGFVNAPGYDYNLMGSSAAVEASAPAGSAGAFSLTPLLEYVHPSYNQGKIITGTLDIGAHEYLGNMIASEILAGSGIKIFPNPSSGSFFIESTEKTQVEIFDIFGKRVFCEEIVGKRSVENQLLHGIYFVKAQNKNGTSARKLIIE